MLQRFFLNPDRVGHNINNNSRYIDLKRTGTKFCYLFDLNFDNYVLFHTQDLPTILSLKIF